MYERRIATGTGARVAKAKAVLARANERPIALEYLADRFWRLHAMREFDPMNGARPFTIPFLRDAAAMFGWRFDPLEIEALVILDRAVRHPGQDAEKGRL